MSLPFCHSLYKSGSCIIIRTSKAPVAVLLHMAEGLVTQPRATAIKGWSVSCIVYYSILRIRVDSMPGRWIASILHRNARECQLRKRYQVTIASRSTSERFPTQSENSRLDYVEVHLECGCLCTTLDETQADRGYSGLVHISQGSICTCETAESLLTNRMDSS